MDYISYYESPLGTILLLADSTGLKSLNFKDQKYSADVLDKEYIEKDIDVLIKTKKWLDSYFNEEIPDFNPLLHIEGTSFQKEVWNILLTIPYGSTMSYKEIAEIIGKRRNIKRFSSQAVGGAVKRNKISIIIPCHRVIGNNMTLIGYAAGLDKKKALLEIEKVYLEK